MNFEDLTPEQQERARSVKSPEEVLALAKEVGYELSDEELDGISGGGSWGDTCWTDCTNECEKYKPIHR